MAGSGDALPPPRELLSFEERVRLMAEVLPKLTATGQSACGRARATVGYGCSLDELRLDWDRLRADLELRRGPRNELVGAEHLARIAESAVVAAIRELLVLVNNAFHKPAPSGADLENRYYDEYWGLPEHLRPDAVGEYIRERKSAEGPRATAEQQRESDERAAGERIARVLATLPSDPREVLRSEPGVVLTPEVVEAKERAARELARLRRIDTATATFQGKDDERSPSVIVTSDYAAPFALWLHPEVFTRVGSQLDRVIPACAAKARAGFAALVEGDGGGTRQGKAV